MILRQIWRDEKKTPRGVEIVVLAQKVMVVMLRAGVARARKYHGEEESHFLNVRKRQRRPIKFQFKLRSRPRSNALASALASALGHTRECIRRLSQSLFNITSCTADTC